MIPRTKSRLNPGTLERSYRNYFLLTQSNQFIWDVFVTFINFISQRRQTAPHLDTTVIQNSASHNAKYLALPSYDLRLERFFRSLSVV